MGSVAFGLKKTLQYLTTKTGISAFLKVLENNLN